MKMTKTKSVLALLLALAFVLSAFACSGGSEKNSRKKTDKDSQLNTSAPSTEAAEETPAPTPEPTATPEPTPTPVPTPAPGEYENFDRATMTYSDEYISFLVPDEIPCAFDYTADMQDVYDYELYLMFTPSASSTSPNLSYFVMTDVDDSEADEVYADMSLNELEDLLKEVYETMFGMEVELNTTRYESFSGSNYHGIILEYNMVVSGMTMNQCVWSVINDQKTALSLAYTWMDYDPLDISASVASITIK